MSAKARPVVIDASVALSSALHPPQVDSRALIAVRDGRGLAPTLFADETGTALARAKRRRTVSPSHAKDARAWLAALPLRLVELFPPAVSDLAEDQRLARADAAYLRLALDEAAALATHDRALERAASRCGVIVWPA